MGAQPFALVAPAAASSSVRKACRILRVVPDARRARLTRAAAPPRAMAPQASNGFRRPKGPRRSKGSKAP
jgi:hypothetical protein